MPADLSHFSGEKRWGEQWCGCAVLIAEALDKQWWKFMALSFQDREHSTNEFKLLVMQPGSSLLFRGRFSWESCCVPSRPHLFNENSLKIGAQLPEFSYREAQTPEQFDAGLVFETSCLSSLLRFILSLFPAAGFLLRFHRRLQIQRFIILLLIFFTQQYFDQFNHLHGECGSLGSYLAY